MTTLSVQRDDLARLHTARVIAVIRGETCPAAVAVAEALVEGGITAIELTFTTPDAPRAIATLADRLSDRVSLGAGTITSGSQATDAAAAGARFLISPGYDQRLAEQMLETGRAVIPGVVTPTEVMAASTAGFTTLKLFPGSLGGPAHLRALRGPFPDIDFIPTGGVSRDNVTDWFAVGAVAVGAGSQIAPPRVASSAHRQEIVDVARDLVSRAHQTRN
jgi:2-dehydro-3-deoxyphosphogluconate aldolase/(4S)-4-hydroxy-2-oxoglutarate aldolase